MPLVRTNFTISQANHDWLSEQAQEIGEKAMSRVLDGLLLDLRVNGPLLQRMELQADRLENLAVRLSPYTLQSLLRNGRTFECLEEEELIHGD